MLKTLLFSTLLITSAFSITKTEYIVDKQLNQLNFNFILDSTDFDVYKKYINNSGIDDKKASKATEMWSDLTRTPLSNFDLFNPARSVKNLQNEFGERPKLDALAFKYSKFLEGFQKRQPLASLRLMSFYVSIISEMDIDEGALYFGVFKPLVPGAEYVPEKRLSPSFSIFLAENKGVQRYLMSTDHFIRFGFKKFSFNLAKIDEGLKLNNSPFAREDEPYYLKSEMFRQFVKAIDKEDFSRAYTILMNVEIKDPSLFLDIDPQMSDKEIIDEVIAKKTFYKKYFYEIFYLLTLPDDEKKQAKYTFLREK